MMTSSSFQLPSAKADLAPFHPVHPNERVFTLRNHMALWFSLGVGLLVIQMGAYLVPALGTRSALLAIVIGSVMGAALLGWVAQIGCSLGLKSAGLMQLTYGTDFARVPVFLNVIQLLGWTAFELVIMREGLTQIAQSSLGWRSPWLPAISTLALGAVLFALTYGTMTQVIRKLIGRLILPLVVLSLIWLTLQFAQRAAQMDGGFMQFWLRSGTGEMGILSAIDLVIAMPISWLPLVADYARYGCTPAQGQGRYSAFRGTSIGYVCANLWCYALGVLIVSTSTADADLLSTILLAQLGLIALGFILFDELDNAYGDVYSGSVSLNHLAPRRSVPLWGRMLTIAAVLAALILPMHALEPFLLMLSSVFVPLFGVIVAQLGFGKIPAHISKIRLPLVLIWLLGITIFHLCGHYTPQWGSSIPTLLITFILAKWFK